MRSQMVLAIPIGAEWYAVELRSVREVLVRPPIAPLPGVDRWLRGLVNVRGDILPTIDIGVARGGVAQPEPSHVAVIDTPSGPAALLTSGVPDAQVPDDVLAPDGAATAGRVVLGGRVATVLRPEDLLERPR